MKKQLTILAAMLLVAGLGLGASLYLSGCAQLGGGPTNAVVSNVVPSTLDINAAVLLDNATLTCNASAADQYNFNMGICANPQAFINQLPPVPLSTITPAQEVGAITLACATGSYTNPAMPQNIIPGPPNVCAATPAGKAQLAKFAH